MKKPTEIRREVKTFYGIEYALILVETKKEKESGGEEINPNQWWNLEYTPKSLKICRYTGRDMLFGDTYYMKQARMKDKYHQMELKALKDIHWLMDGFYLSRIKWLSKELFYFFYSAIVLIPRRIFYWSKVILGKQKRQNINNL